MDAIPDRLIHVNILACTFFAALPFFWLMLLATALLTVFPQIALFLPSKM